MTQREIDHIADIGKKAEGDCISRQKAIEALARMMPRSYTPDGSHPGDEEIFRAQEVFADCIEALEILPPAQPEPHWILCSERLPEEYGNYLITTYDGDVDIGSIDPSRKGAWSACDADGFYWLRNVIAWMPLPEPYRGGGE